ncbi:MFS transporter [Bradyrhizobium elkanii]|uniref:MFS transporter n=1 Tax=Bradyrhizobium elkanii TaxID=29448 RepID=UPI0004BAF568|nr:MFS transporter [Bradyrhizobium elkanii]WLA83290.1 MFS transporter [Bradyrhizobium elkanii]
MQTTSLNTRQPEQAGSGSASSRSPLAAALALAATSLGLGVVQLDITIVNTALSSISISLGGSVAELQWVVTAYTIAFAAFILTAGALGDRVGAKRIFIGGFAIFTLASLACALAPSAMFLIVARSVQGLAAAILVPNSLALLNHAYTDPKARGRAVGLWAAGASVALTARPLVGGALIALVSWRAIFLVNLPIGAAGLLLAWRYAKETPRLAQREIDLPGQIAAIATLGTLAGALIEGGALGWSHPLVIMGFAGAAVIGLLFVWREARAPQPMLPLSLFRHHMFALTALVGLLFNIAFYGLIFVLSLYFQNVNGWSPFATGLAFVPMMAMVLPANLIAASVSERLGAPQTIALACMITAAGCVALLPMDSGAGYGAIGAQLVILGGGLGLLVPSLTSTLLGSVEKSRSGIAAGVLNATRQTGSVLGVALFGSLVAGNNAFMTGVHASLVISAAVLLAGAVAIWQGRAKKGR